MVVVDFCRAVTPVANALFSLRQNFGRRQIHIDDTGDECVSPVGVGLETDAHLGIFSRQFV
jgi:hypothetical protein